MQAPKARIPASIIIANYNYARFLDRCINSALNQNHSNVEVIVVDDASSDESRDVIRSYGSRVISCMKTRNAGHAAAFNTGFAASSGAVVFFLDADDYLYPDAVSTVIDACDSATTQAQFRLHVVDEERRVTDTYPPPELPFDEGNVMPALLRRGRYQTTVTSGLAFDRRTLEAILPIPEAAFRQGADGYLVTVAPVHGRVTAIDSCLGAYRRHGANHSAFNGRLAEGARWRIQHDFHRMAALSRQTAEVGMTLADDVCLRDPTHLEQRLASLCADETRHPVAEDSRLALGTAGAAASMELKVSLRRRAFLAAWFLSVGLLPRRMARAVLSWKLIAASRPRALAALSKVIRRSVG